MQRASLFHFSYLRRLPLLIWVTISHALTLLLSLSCILLSVFEITVISSHWAFLIKTFGGDLVLLGGDLLPFSKVFSSISEAKEANCFAFVRSS